ncbi:ATP-binding cassette domain-containing protein [Streptomyces sp. DSM 41972]|uniref:ATP-binding cassette domain-containing protein n=1 Tax=Streptomyces althioticus subsp. attaecolombicae TaxID=3075534 RepID=A0ABU3I1E0_9ACTN|nr:ATP-binding cassette domain-containing protein [Streptomyces sp. DSM 41972]SCD31180.1 ABC-2 type transport system ATP-binding protein [Streptomyces sp. di50b]SCE29311.1 ABC-2 type transport system ATP-binding protein [Streptomyces sp. di188]
MTTPVAARFSRATKQYGSHTAVEDLTFDVAEGRIVGLLGRNGAGKSTALRMLLGLVSPSSGSTTVFGQPYADLPRAAHRIGVSMDGIGSLPAASGRRDLRIWAKTLGLPKRRVDEVLEQVGLLDDPKAADRPVEAYSTGMRQRHGLASALLADPELLVLDEPANGLDPDGIRWLRRLLRSLADEGRTILLSSHLLTEVEQIVDDVVIIQRTLRHSGTLESLTEDGRHRLEDRFFDVVDGEARTAPEAPRPAGGGGRA